MMNHAEKETVLRLHGVKMDAKTGPRHAAMANGVTAIGLMLAATEIDRTRGVTAIGRHPETESAVRTPIVAPAIVERVIVRASRRDVMATVPMPLGRVKAGRIIHNRRGMPKVCALG